MKFKFSVEFLIVVFLFISIMIISTYGSTKIMPFEQKSAKLPMYAYEGFEDEEDEDEDKKPITEGLENADTVKPNCADTPQWVNVNNGPDKILDIMSQQKTDNSCSNISNGLSKSTGYLCPTEDVQELQRTRGGNYTGSSGF